MKSLTFIVSVLWVFIACDSETSTNTRQTEQTTENTQQCFMIKTPYDEIEIDGEIVELADVVQLSFTVNDGEVVGRYDYVPAERDAMWGVFKGTIDDNGKITGTYISIQEGMTSSVEIVIELKNEVALIDGETLPKTDCANLLTPPDYAVNIEIEDVYSGTYEYEDETSSGSVVIEMTADNTISFKIEIGNMEGCTGEISGNATIEESNFATYSDENCTDLSFEFMDNKLTIKEGDCFYYHGMACTFSEEYVKK